LRTPAGLDAEHDLGPADADVAQHMVGQQLKFMRVAALALSLASPGDGGP